VAAPASDFKSALAMEFVAINRRRWIRDMTEAASDDCGIDAR
jgi:hypothetical protein